MSSASVETNGMRVETVRQLQLDEKVVAALNEIPDWSAMPPLAGHWHNTRYGTAAHELFVCEAGGSFCVLGKHCVDLRPRGGAIRTGNTSNSCTEPEGRRFYSVTLYIPPEVRSDQVLLGAVLNSMERAGGLDWGQKLWFPCLIPEMVDAITERASKHGSVPFDFGEMLVTADTAAEVAAEIGGITLPHLAGYTFGRLVADRDAPIINSHWSWGGVALSEAFIRHCIRNNPEFTLAMFADPMTVDTQLGQVNGTRRGVPTNTAGEVRVEGAGADIGAGRAAAGGLGAGRESKLVAWASSGVCGEGAFLGTHPAHRRQKLGLQIGYYNYLQHRRHSLGAFGFVLPGNRASLALNAKDDEHYRICRCFGYVPYSMPLASGNDRSRFHAFLGAPSVLSHL